MEIIDYVQFPWGWADLRDPGMIVCYFPSDSEIYRQGIAVSEDDNERVRISSGIDPVAEEWNDGFGVPISAENAILYACTDGWHTIRTPDPLDIFVHRGEVIRVRKVIPLKSPIAIDDFHAGLRDKYYNLNDLI